MINENERAKIRARCNIPVKDTWHPMFQAKEDIKNLLNAMDELEKDRDTWKASAEAGSPPRMRGAFEKGGQFGMYHVEGNE